MFQQITAARTIWSYWRMRFRYNTLKILADRLRKQGITIEDTSGLRCVVCTALAVQYTDTALIAAWK